MASTALSGGFWLGQLESRAARTVQRARRALTDACTSPEERIAAFAFAGEAARRTIASVVQTEQDRLRAVLEAAIVVTSELSIEAVLQRIVEAAAKLTSAQYAALGVIDQKDGP